MSTRNKILFVLAPLAVAALLSGCAAMSNLFGNRDCDTARASVVDPSIKSLQAIASGQSAAVVSKETLPLAGAYGRSGAANAVGVIPALCAGRTARYQRVFPAHFEGMSLF